MRALGVVGGVAAAGVLALGGRRQPTPPSVTLLYQNFPNPFPNAESASTCVWFDLAEFAAVSLTIHDARGNLVRRLVPRPGQSGTLPPGRYGRAVPGSGVPCSPGFSWDGRAQDGTFVPRGVYLIRLRANGIESIKKALFQGP